LETWDVSKWKKTNWRISVLRRRMFIWTRNNLLKIENELFLSCFEHVTTNFKRVFLEIMFLEVAVVQNSLLIIRLTWNVIYIFELNIATAWTRDFMITHTRSFFLIYNKKAQKFQQKKTIFFTTPSFSEKLFFLVYAVKKPLLIIKNFDFLF